MHSADAVFTVLQSVDSTNNYAMGKVHAGLARHGNACFTMNQTQGRGQRGRQWLGATGQNIAISIIIAPSVLAISQQFLLSAAVAVAAWRFFNKYSGGETFIKWPNDIFWCDRKAAGILIENVIGYEKNDTNAQGTPVWKYAVAGIGVNINQTNFDPALRNPVSLKQITGKSFDCTVLAAELHQEVMNEVNAVLAGNNKGIIELYNQQLYKRNAYVLLKRGSVQFETMIKSVSPDGKLHTTDIIDNEFNFGEVEWVL